MKNIIGIILIFINTVVIADMFENNFDRPSSYKFDVNSSFNDQRMSEILKLFQEGKATEDEIKAYLIIRDDNKTTPLDDKVSIIYGDNLHQKSIDLKKEEKSDSASWFQVIKSMIVGDDKNATDSNITQEENN